MLIDSHCHIPHEKYGMTPAEVVSDAKNLDVTKLISVGTSLKEADLVIKTSHLFPNVYPTVGVYPHEDQDKSLEELETGLRKILIEHEDIVGIGECGIDISNYDKARSVEDQVRLFEMQIKLAKENSLPLIVHNRDGDKYILDLISKHIDIELRGVVHCFDSDWEFADKILELGFYISFSGMITYPKKEQLIEVVKKVPFNKFLVETDAPYLKPWGIDDKSNYPKYVRIIADKVAELKGIPVKEVEKNSYKNTCSLFYLDE